MSDMTPEVVRRLKDHANYLRILASAVDESDDTRAACTAGAGALESLAQRMGVENPWELRWSMLKQLHFGTRAARDMISIENQVPVQPQTSEAMGPQEAATERVARNCTALLEQAEARVRDLQRETDSLISACHDLQGVEAERDVYRIGRDALAQALASAEIEVDRLKTINLNHRCPGDLLDGIEVARITAERDEYKTLSGIGRWHNDCRPNRHMAAREIAKSQAVIDKLADTITTLTAERDTLRSQVDAAIDSISDYQHTVLFGPSSYLESLAAILRPAPVIPAPDKGPTIQQPLSDLDRAELGVYLGLPPELRKSYSTPPDEPEVIPVPDLDPPPGKCWAPAENLERCTFAPHADGPHSWERGK